MLYIRIDIRHLCLASIAKFAMADFEENVEEMVGKTREAAGGDRVRRGRDRWSRQPRERDRRRQLVTNETAATGGVMYAEGPYTIDVRHLCLASIAKFCDGGL